MSAEGAVRAFLAAPLDAPRVWSLEKAADQVAALPLDDVLTGLRSVLQQPITGEDSWRLHVLTSTLHHRHLRADTPGLIGGLREAIEKARTREEVT